jgi:hypothetical protein
MTTSVKMDEETKSRLEDLQAEIKLETGRKVTQQELLDRIVTHAFATKSEVVDSFRERTVPLSDEEIERFNEGTFDSGIETDEDDEDDIDRPVYEEDHV